MAPTRHNPGQTETRAFASLFLGIASFAFGPLAGIPAIALGSAARKSIAQTGVKSRGTLVASAGTLIGFFGMGFFAVFTMYLGNAVLSANANPDSAQDSAQMTQTPVGESQAKLTAPVAPSRPSAHRELEMMHSPR